MKIMKESLKNWHKFVLAAGAVVLVAWVAMFIKSTMAQIIPPGLICPAECLVGYSCDTSIGECVADKWWNGWGPVQCNPEVGCDDWSDWICWCSAISPDPTNNLSCWTMDPNCSNGWGGNGWGGAGGGAQYCCPSRIVIGTFSCPSDPSTDAGCYLIDPNNPEQLACPAEFICGQTNGWGGNGGGGKTSCTSTSPIEPALEVCIGGPCPANDSCVCDPSGTPWNPNDPDCGTTNGWGGNGGGWVDKTCFAVYGKYKPDGDILPELLSMQDQSELKRIGSMNIENVAKIHEVLGSQNLIMNIENLYRQMRTKELTTVKTKVNAEIAALPVGFTEEMWRPVVANNYVALVYIPVHTAEDLEQKWVGFRMLDQTACRTNAWGGACKVGQTSCDPNMCWVDGGVCGVGGTCDLFTRTCSVCGDDTNGWGGNGWGGKCPTSCDGSEASMVACSTAWGECLLRIGGGSCEYPEWSSCINGWGGNGGGPAPRCPRTCDTDKDEMACSDMAWCNGRCWKEELDGSRPCIDLTIEPGMLETIQWDNIRKDLTAYFNPVQAKVIETAIAPMEVVIAEAVKTNNGNNEAKTDTLVEVVHQAAVQAAALIVEIPPISVTIDATIKNAVIVAAAKEAAATVVAQVIATAPTTPPAVIAAVQAAVVKAVTTITPEVIKVTGPVKK